MAEIYSSANSLRVNECVKCNKGAVSVNGGRANKACSGADNWKDINFKRTAAIKNLAN